MAKCLLLEAKVVRSSVIGVLFLFAFFDAISQSRATRTSSEKITIHCDGCKLQYVLNELEHKGGIHFIYSTNVVEVDKLISIHIIGEPLDEVLHTIETEMNIVFKRNGQHVVIKNRENTVETNSAKPKKVTEATATFNPEKKLSGFSGNIRYKSSALPPSAETSVHSPVFGKVVFKKPQVVFSQYFDAKKLPALPARYIRSVNLRNNHPGWYLSTGLVLNDYSAGAEVHAGLRSVFLVYSPTWLSGGRYLGAYGLGTSMLLKSNLSINTIYSFGTLNEEASYADKSFEIFSRDDLASSSKHHRFKFLLQYSLTRNISLRGGLAINFLETIRYLPEGGFAATRTTIGSFHTIPPSGVNTSLPYQRVIARGYSESPPDIKTFRIWMGWETSLAYRFNFFQRRR